MAKLPQRTKGRPWSVKIVARLRGVWGYCDYDNKEIVLSKATEKHGVGRQVFLHELTHKLLPWMAEDAVDHFATEIDDALETYEQITPG